MLPFGHFEQMKSRSLMCDFMWVVRILCRLKAFGHNSHLRGLSKEWRKITCDASVRLFLKAANKKVKTLNCYSTKTIICWRCENLPAPHVSHSCFLPSGCTYHMWLASIYEFLNAVFFKYLSLLILIKSVRQIDIKDGLFLNYLFRISCKHLSHLCGRPTYAHKEML